jgi:hypothetical protein
MDMIAAIVGALDKREIAAIAVTGGNAGDRLPHSGSPDQFTKMVGAFEQGLKEKSYIDGQNVTRRT